MVKGLWNGKGWMVWTDYRTKTVLVEFSVSKWGTKMLFIFQLKLTLAACSGVCGK